MPLFGTVTRVRKGLFEVVIKFIKSHRTLHVERIGAPNVAAVKLFFRLEYPTLVWGKPKTPRIKVAKVRFTNASKPKQEKARVIKRAAKKVLRKRKKSVRRKVQNSLPTARRRNPKASAEL